MKVKREKSEKIHGLNLHMYVSCFVHNKYRMMSLSVIKRVWYVCVFFTNGFTALFVI